MSLGELPPLTPISDGHACFVGKEVPRELAIGTVVVLILGSVESSDKGSHIRKRWRGSVERINDALGLGIVAGW